MLKVAKSVKSLEARALEALKAVLSQIPSIKVKGVDSEAQAPDGQVDILARLSIGGKRHTLACEVKADGQPRHVRVALLQLRNYMVHLAGDATPVLIAPFLSLQAQSLCREQGVSFLDLEGNIRLIFDGIFIERSVANRPAVERRELRSLFKPKSAQVLRAMLRDPVHAWRVAELAKAAAVSLGHINNVKVGLLDREWGEVSDNGLFLSAPDMLLDTWRDAYEPPSGKRMGFYTTLHGGAFENAVRQVLRVESEKGRAVFASFSAAQWLAPYARTGTQYFYADEAGVRRLEAALTLSSPSRGENVIVTIPKDEGLFRSAVEPAPGAVCTDPVQTYLDLVVAGERGGEAAEHLRRELMKWSK
jgi:Transcriptional regulator, AbiEi antitoxin, Type IV TA system